MARMGADGFMRFGGREVWWDLSVCWNAFEVEFCDGEGRTFALLPVSAENVIRLYDAPELVAA
jgi:hypothetical protein